MTTGFNDVLKNLNREIRKIEGGTLAGVLEAGNAIKAEAQERTPVDVGPLRASAFAGAEMQGNRAVARVGYTAKYAAWVHEMPGTLKGQPRANFGITGNRSEVGPVKPISFGGGSGKGRYWDSGEPKFLEKAVKENIPLILKVIQKRAKVQ